MLTPELWDALAEAIAWMRQNADVLADSHGIGGDPAAGQPYGFAAWSPRREILLLRNPGKRPATISLDVQDAWELPRGAASRYVCDVPGGAPPISRRSPFRPAAHTISSSPRWRSPRGKGRPQDK